MRKLGDFLPRSWCVLETVRYMAILAIDVEWEPYPSYRMVALLMTLSDPTPSFKVTLQFEAEYLANMTSLGFLSNS